jgi:hypothetical protein
MACHAARRPSGSGLMWSKSPNEIPLRPVFFHCDYPARKQEFAWRSADRNKRLRPREEEAVRVQLVQDVEKVLYSEKPEGRRPAADITGASDLAFIEYQPSSGRL